MDAAVGPHGKCGANCFLALLHAHGHGDHFGRGPGFEQANRFFDGNFIERVHGHFNVGGLNAGLVRFDTNLDVVIDHPFDGDEEFHRSISLRCGAATGFEGLSACYLLPTGAHQEGRYLASAKTTRVPPDVKFR